MTESTAVDCEKSSFQNENTRELLTSVLLVLSITINEYIKYLNINTEKCNSAELFVEQFFKQSKLKANKKRGRPKKEKPDYSEQNEIREELFYKFWAMYPRKEAEANAKRQWLRIRQLEAIFPKIMEALAWQIPKWEDGKYAPAPAKYILDKRWNDAPEFRKPKTGAFGDLDYAFPKN